MEKRTEKDYDDDIEAKMLQMFGDESKENESNENVRKSSRSRKKISHYKDEQKAAIVHKVEKIRLLPSLQDFLNAPI